MSDQTAPLISVTLNLDPPSITESEAMELSVTAVSHAPYPITILDYWTIFNVYLAQSLRRSSGNFHLHDIDTNTELTLQHIGCIKRGAIRYELDHSDSQYFHTLRPNTPYKFRGPCHVSHMELVPGHRYRLSVGEEEKVWWWRQGTKEEVLELPGRELPKDKLKPAGGPITLTDITPVEFMVPSDWKNIGASVSEDISAMLYAGARFWGPLKPPSTTLSLHTSSLSNGQCVELVITAVSHASCPITIWSYMTALNMRSIPKALIITHVDTDISVSTQEMFFTRQGWVVHPNDRYFHTLLPEQPFTFSKPIRAQFLKELECLPGQYRVAVKDSTKLRWWKEGTREEIVPPPGQKPADDMYVASGEPIVLNDIQPIEFTIPVSH